mmetsp:Transcript_686/g.1446  ORF Transcript_686/g.1446 Transcript_686/m.1446 type:complete len:116 (+) Transcript_686:619-966(+)
MRQQSRRDEGAFVGYAPHVDDLFERDVDLDVADPEPQAAVVEYVDGSDAVVPEPGHHEEVAKGDGNDGAMGADWNCHNQEGNEYGLKDDKSDFEGRRERRRRKANVDAAVVGDVR